MSEQTPDTNNGMSEGQDPSMEDILASIRKIIADDDVQAVDDGEGVDETVELETSQGDVTELAHVETLDLDILEDEAPALDTGLEADIDVLIGDIDVESVDDFTAPQIETLSMSDEVLDDVLDLEIPMEEADTAPVTASMPDPIIETLDLTVDEPLAMDDEIAELVADIDEDIITRPEEPKRSRGLMGGAMAALGLGGAAAAAKASTPDTPAPAEDDLSLMLDNMLEDSSAHQEDASEDAVPEETVIDPAEDLLSDIELSEDIAEDMTPSDADPDMDLVKSLMADLTEEPLHDEEEPETETETDIAVTDIDDEEDANSDDVMDEILNMTLDDETKLSEEIAIPEITTPSLEDAEAESLSLKDIAAQAEADAESSESILGKGMAAAAGLGVVGTAIAASAQDDDAAEELEDLLSDDAADLEDLDIENPEPQTPESLNEETPDMATANKRSAKKSDAIIDEVTETATTGAFASLTNVVEEKAVKAERGDRIGDLVMEALQPMLKEWLDANLKGIVERAVTKEVKRISSGK